MKTSMVILSAVLAVLMAHEAPACGDSLYRVGTGISYREYSAPLPGNVLIYGEAAGTTELAEALTRSGHTVRLAGSEEALAAELQKMTTMSSSHRSANATQSMRSRKRLLQPFCRSCRTGTRSLSPWIGMEMPSSQVKTS